MKRVLLALFAVVACAGCDIGLNPGTPSGEPTTGAPGTVSSARASVTMTVSPSPVISTSSGDARAPRQARWRVRLRETAGVGATVNFLNATLRDAETGTLAEPDGVLSLNPGEVLAAAGSNHLAPNGTLDVPQVVVFSLASGEEAVGRLTLTVQLTDDTGHVVDAAAFAFVE